MPRVNQEEGSLRISRREREIERVSPRTDSFVYIRVYLLYNVSTRILCHRLGELSKNDCTFRGSARSEGISGVDGR